METVYIIALCKSIRRGGGGKPSGAHGYLGWAPSSGQAGQVGQVLVPHPRRRHGGTGLRLGQGHFPAVDKVLPLLLAAVEWSGLVHDVELVGVIEPDQLGNGVVGVQEEVVLWREKGEL